MKRLTYKICSVFFVLVIMVLFVSCAETNSPSTTTSKPIVPSTTTTVPSTTTSKPTVPSTTTTVPSTTTSRPTVPSTTTTVPSTTTSRPTVPSTTTTVPSTTTSRPTVPTTPSTSETPTIFLAGDSTVKTYEEDQYIGGWGQYLDLFLSDDIEVVNCAQGGRSSRSFINEGRLWDIADPSFKYTFTQNFGNSIEDSIEAGDYLFIQFGHNDDNTKVASSYSTMYDRMVPLGEADSNGIYPITAGTKVSTSSLPAAYVSVANDSEESKALTEIAKYGSTYYSYDCGGTYKWFLKQYIDFARAKGATPVLVTPVARVKFSGPTIIGGAGLHGENFAYVEAVRQLAEEEDCLLVDLFADSKTMLETTTSTSANYLMALKPNDLTGTWPSGYDVAYGNSAVGYTGIEATHYNKYGAFLQAAKVAEHILNTEAVNNGEYFNFSSKVLTIPEKYIDPSNLMTKAKVNQLEQLFNDIIVANPNRVYKDPADVVALIDAMTAKGDVTNDNYLDFQAECQNIRNEYVALNIDDRSSVTNFSVLLNYEDSVAAFVEANRPVPTRVVTFSADSLSLGAISSSKTVDGFTLYGSVEVKSAASSFTYNGDTYSTNFGVSMGGKATFGTSRYISFSVDAPCTITVVAKSSGSSDRTVALVNSSNTQLGLFDAKASLSVTSLNIESTGSYSIGSTGSGLYIYYIIIEYFE